MYLYQSSIASEKFSERIEREKQSLAFFSAPVNLTTGQRKPAALIAVDPIVDFLNICVWTAVLEDEQPVSVVMLADSGSGKSEILKRLVCPISHFITDMTTRDLSNIMADSKKRIILLSDMQAIFSHKSTVSSMTTQALRNLLEEGIFNDPFSGTSINRRFGMISAIPPNEFDRVNKIFISGGLNTRFLIFEYAYKAETIKKIHKSIETKKRDKDKIFALPEDGEYVKVSLPAKIAADCRRLAMLLKRENEMGIRVHHQIRRLVMANAARHGRRVASKSDMETIAKFSAFLTSAREIIKL